jgi:alkylated DNA repair dioxygenase AlkB
MSDQPFFESLLISEEKAQTVFNDLRTQLNWERRVDAPRSEYWTNTFNRPYTYGSEKHSRTYEAQPTHSHIEEIRDLIMGYTKRLWDIDAGYEGCFLNMYTGGRDWLGWHADDDLGIDHSKPIAIVTLGDSRKLHWKEIGSKGVESINEQLLTKGSLFLMNPGMQQSHLHRIPKMVEVDENHCRISLTYRCLQ